MADSPIFSYLFYRDSPDCAVIYSQKNEKWVANILVVNPAYPGICIHKALEAKPSHTLGFFLLEEIALVSTIITAPVDVSDV